MELSASGCRGMPEFEYPKGAVTRSNGDGRRAQNVTGIVMKHIVASNRMHAEIVHADDSCAHYD